MKKIFLAITILICIFLVGCKIQSVEQFTENDDTTEITNSSSDSSCLGADNSSSSDVKTETTGREIASSNNSVSSASSNKSASQEHITSASSYDVQAPKTEEKLICSIKITCTTILSNMDKFNKNKTSLVPKNGVILELNNITFQTGDSVFDVLNKQTKRNRIHMEFVDTPVYQSAYINGINNIYEFDCGDLSGWMYSVNKVYPNYGCSKYKISNDDVIEWNYTCDLGRDLGQEWIK